MGDRAMPWRLVCGGMFGRGDTKTDDVRAIVRSAALEWPKLIVLADTHLVSPALWLGLRAQGSTESLPEDARQYLEALYRMNLARNVAITAQLEEAVEALNGRGISPLLLKGAAYLVLRTHGDAGARVVFDLDLLIPERRIATARSILNRIGYKAIRRDRPGHHHLAPLARDGSPAAIELHRDVLIPQARNIAPAALVWRKRVVDGTAGYSVPCATHAVLHRFVHDQIVDRHAHQFVISFRAMQDLVALDAFYGAQIDWTWLADRARRFGYAEELSDYVYAASRVAGMTIPRSVRITRRQAVTFAVCRAAEHSRTLGSAIAVLERFSAHRIERLSDDGRSGRRSLAADRLRLVARMIRSGLRPGV